ncbi:MAG: 50S ribosomal protein L3 [candidate division KSB1 bacterium]|nr:50S ribosomal protein L3 [candidate division KSB1 bacterium]MDZ7370910.1 50S ribosomal protein L3 [candidate division KSB1 bacterium]
MRGIIGKKLGMTRIFDKAGNATAATVIEAGPCYVTQIKTVETDGYNAVQFGFDEKREKSANKPEKGHAAKAGLKPFKILREFRDFESPEPLQLGQSIKADIFKEGEKVKVTGTSKGKGFAGVVKRHHFGGGPKTHGQSDRLRAPGSLGQSSFPSRVFKGLRMAGRMGGDTVTVRNLEILKVDAENNIIVVKGAVPGAANGYVLIRK